MSEKYKFGDPQGIYFVTSTIINWLNVFNKPVYQQIILNALFFAINHKGLQLHAWVIMSNYIHLIISAKNGEEGQLATIMRDFKRFTSNQIIQQLKQEDSTGNGWMLRNFRAAASKQVRHTNYKVWQDGNHPIQIDFTGYLEQKLNYLHQNPVRAGLVTEPEHYRLSSAIDYAGGKGLLPVTLLF